MTKEQAHAQVDPSDGQRRVYAISRSHHVVGTAAAGRGRMLAVCATFYLVITVLWRRSAVDLSATSDHCLSIVFR